MSMSMSLAQQLDELALANSQGLLNDDEYRILRQDLFHRHINTPLVVATTAPRPLRNPIINPSPRIPSLSQPDDDHHKPRARHKSPFTTGVSNLVKRITTASIKHDPPRPSTAPPKLGVKPLLNKATAFFYARTETKKRFHNPSLSSPPTSPRHHPISPLSSSTRSDIPTFPSNHVQLPANTGIFDDGNLYTSKDFRAAIIATQLEAQRLMDTFNNLEPPTSPRQQQHQHQQHQQQQQQQQNQSPRRLPSATVPEHELPLIDPSDWPLHRPSIHSPSTAPLHGQIDRKSSHHYQHVHPATLDSSTTNDGASVRSASSSTISRSKSISSLRSRQHHHQQQQQQHPGSPLSAKFSQSGIHRKGSVSSISSQTHSARKFMVSPGVSSSWSRSTGHLPLSMLVEGDDTQDSLPSPELTEIQRRKADVMARYVARIRFLEARLDAVERHEMLSRR